MFMRWAYARVRLSEIRALENKGVGIVVKRLEFKAMIEFIQIVLAAVITVLLYLTAFYSLWF